MTLSYVQQQYLVIPKIRVLVNSYAIDGLIKANVSLPENAYWTATLTFQNIPNLYPDTIDVGTEVTVEVQDGAVGGAWKTLFTGTVLFPDYNFNGEQALITFQCVGVGYALNMMNCAEEYGVQSRNPTIDSIQGILTNASVGVIPKHVNSYLGGSNASGYNITTTYVENLTGSIPYLYSPYKPVDKLLVDLCDLHTAISESSSLAGPHWIVDHSGNLRLKRIGATQTGWTKYYGNSQANATLTQGLDFTDGDFQPVGKEANVIIYSGIWRRPSSGDARTEGYASNWSANEFTTVSDETSVFIVGAKSIKLVSSGGAIEGRIIPDEPWDFSVFAPFMEPTFNFYIRRTGSSLGVVIVGVRLIDSDGDQIYCQLCSFTAGIGGGLVAADDTWFHASLPIGTYYRQIKAATAWTTEIGTFDWSSVAQINIEGTDTITALYVDGLYFGGAPIIRIARKKFPSEGGTLGYTAATSLLTANAAAGQKTVAVTNGALFTAGDDVIIYDDDHAASFIIDYISTNNVVSTGNLPYTFYTAKNATLIRVANPIRTKVLSDNVGKDDSLNASDDSGLLAQLAKAELLRCTTESTNGKFTLPLLSDVLPGQYFYFGNEDWRITKVTHLIEYPDTFATAIDVTDDLLNSSTRLRYEDINKVYAAIRPEWQDRSASSLKASDIDIRVVPLEKAY